jgi:hypothetical protein
VVAGILVALPLGTPAAFAAPARPVAAPAFPAGGADAACFVAAINSARAQMGEAPLASDGALLALAARHSQQMAGARTIYHNLDIGRQAPSYWVRLGENVGRGPTCGDIARAFMESPEHRVNILNAHYNLVGVSVVIGQANVLFVTEDFMEAPGGGAAPAAPAPGAPTVQPAPPPPPNPPAPALPPPARNTGLFAHVADLLGRAVSGQGPG